MTAIQEPVIKTTPFDDLIANFDKIRSLYTVEEPLETFKLIIEQEVMVTLILEAHSKIRELFPSERLALEVTTDPEIAGWRSLWIIIYTKLAEEFIFNQLKSQKITEIGRDLTRLRQMRNKADYADTIFNLQIEAKKALKLAQNIMTSLSELNQSTEL